MLLLLLSLMLLQELQLLPLIGAVMLPPFIQETGAIIENKPKE
jgi:hypothetical protein